MIFDLVIIIAFFVVNLLIGYCSSFKMKSLSQFSVGNRAFSATIIFATLAATFIGGGYTLGNAAKVYSIGLLYPFALLGFSLKEILVATFIAPRMDAHRDCLTIGDIMAKRYGVGAKVVTGIFALIVCAGILGAQVGAMGAIFEQFFNVSPLIGVFVSFAVMIWYASVGGMRAVVYTDVFQFVILIVGIPLAFFIGAYQIGSWEAFTSKIPEKHLYFISNKSDLLVFTSLFVTFILGETLVPPYVQRLLMGDTSTATARGTLAAGLLSIPFFLIVGSIGLIALWFEPNLDPNTALPYVVQTKLPIYLRGILIASLLSIIMSSAAGFLNAAAVAFVNDVFEPLNGAKYDAQKTLWIAKASSFLVGIGSVAFALLINNVLDILVAAYNFWSPIVLMPLCAVIFGFRVNTRDFAVGASMGCATAALWSFGWHEPYGISSIIAGVLANLLGMIASYQWRRMSFTNDDKQDVPA